MKMTTILLIEDNLHIRENTAELLELSGYKVIVAAGGTAGLRKAKELIPDIILCDIMMPELNGYEVIHELKKNSATAGIPFIFITASVEKSEMKKGLDMGASGYIPKPFDENELLTSIESCLKMS
jgi:CheY-like chemotaxis protein